MMLKTKLEKRYEDPLGNNGSVHEGVVRQDSPTDVELTLAEDTTEEPSNNNNNTEAAPNSKDTKNSVDIEAGENDKWNGMNVQNLKTDLQDIETGIANARLRLRKKNKTVELEKGDFDSVCRLVIKIGCLAYKYGTVSFMLERNLTYITKKLGHNGHFVVTPQQITFVFYRDDDATINNQRIHLVKVHTGNSADRLELLSRLEEDIVNGAISVDDAYEATKAIENKPNQWPDYVMALCYAGAGFGFSSLFQVQWIDAGFAALFSLGVFVCLWLGDRFGNLLPFFGKSIDNWMPVLYSFVVAVCISLVKTAFPQINLILTILGSIMIEIPGFTVSLGVGELVTMNILAGVNNILKGVITLVKQVGGAFLGYALIEVFTKIPSEPPGEDIKPVWLSVGVPVLILSLPFYYKTPTRQLPLSWLVTGAAYGFAHLGNELLGNDFGTFFGAACMALVAHTFQLIFRRPVSIFLAPGLLVLVSGSIGFLGIASYVSGDTEEGLQQILTMFTTALLVVLGLIVGTTLLPTAMLEGSL